MKYRTKILFLIVCFFTTQANNLNACTRVVYKGNNNLVLTARSMDWSEEIFTNLWIFPRGMSRNGEVGPNSITWTSKYGSVVASAYEVASTDGMNEKGLVANLLWLVESEYPKWDHKKKGMAVSIWTQYVLDNFATVQEAVNELQQEKFFIVTDNVPGQDRKATVHLSISDATGDNAIIEYINGKLVIHHSKDYNVMTNSPIYEKQLALNEYWKK